MTWAAMKRFYVVLVVLLSLCVWNTNGQEEDMKHSRFTADFPKTVRKQLSDAMKDWIESGNAASYAKITEGETVSIAITINLYFVGFEGDGNRGFKLTEETLAPWFEHIEHSLPHTVVSNGGPIGGNTQNVAASPANTEYNYIFRVVELSPTVRELVEAVINRNLRSVVPRGQPATSSVVLHQVHADALDSELNQLVSDMRLGSSSFNLFLLNPKRPTAVKEGEIYGYRVGMSNEELTHFYHNAELVEKVKKFTSSFSEGEGKAADVNPPLKAWLPTVERPGTKSNIVWKDLRANSEKWAQNRLKAVQEQAATGEFENLLNVYGSTFAGRDYLRHLLMTPLEMSEDCLVDLWVGRQRTAFVDFTAGPFSWGPIVGGEGVRSSASMPRVSHELDHLEITPVHTNVYQQDISQEQVQEELTALTAVLQMGCRNEGLTQEDEKQCNDLETRVGYLRSILEDMKKDGVTHKKITLSAYMDHKEGDDSMLKDLQQEQLESTHEPIQQPDLPHVEAPPHLVSGGAQEGMDADFNQPMNLFLSRVGALIASAITHVVSPAASAVNFPTFFPERVVFHVYHIVTHNAYDSIHQHSFDYETFKYELLQLKLSHQDFTFTLHSLAMSEDPALAMAYSRALRSGVIPTLRLDSSFAAIKRLYLDSTLLQHQLRVVRDKEEGQHRTKSESIRIKTVPIFIFSVDFPLPIFIDKYHQSKVLSDMVLVVQSHFERWESHLACNGKPVAWTLKSTVRQALASTSAFLGGLLPPHIYYSKAHKRTGQNWLWATGDHPWSYLNCIPYSSGFSTLQKDIIYRNYMIGVWNTTVNNVHAAHETLRRIATGENNFNALKWKDQTKQSSQMDGKTVDDDDEEELDLRYSSEQSLFDLSNRKNVDLHSRLSLLSAMQRRIVFKIQNLAYMLTDYDLVDATFQLNEVIDLSEKYRSEAEAIGSVIGSFGCSSDAVVFRDTLIRFDYQVNWLLVATCAVIAVAAVVFVEIRHRKNKLKIN
eukprot:GILJ01010742.1.p1 GENE.GILJ01010742.1~~GILJ01010742.1.p1  ORF type:complete len:1005 (-),score=184.62 GILJ01010742.1:226-3213(-)